LALDSDRQRIQCIVLATPLPEPIRESEKVLFINRIQYGDHRLLHDFILQRGDSKRALSAIGLGYARGNVIVVRYADDSVFGFKSEETARRFLTAMKERLAKFGLSLNATKTRLIEFGRFAATNRKRRGQSKPETFDFLGFTHCCGTDRQGRFQVTRLTVKKRMRATLEGKRAANSS